MPTKIKTIKVSNGHAPADRNATTPAEWEAALRYRVEQVTDSVEYTPGQYLERKVVDELCHSRDWKVTIVPVR